MKQLQRSGELHKKQASSLAPCTYEKPFSGIFNIHSPPPPQHKVFYDTCCRAPAYSNLHLLLVLVSRAPWTFRPRPRHGCVGDSSSRLDISDRAANSRQTVPSRHSGRTTSSRKCLKQPHTVLLLLCCISIAPFFSQVK